MSLQPDEILTVFKETNALLEGHFILTSGLHSGQYFQCAKVFQYPWFAEKLCGDIADNFKNEQIDLVVSPAVAGTSTALGTIYALYESPSRRQFSLMESSGF